MRRIARLSRPIDRAFDTASRTSASSSLCRTCLQRSAAPFSTTTRAAAGVPGSTPFTEKIRSKIWGTEHAPGREDPYLADSPLRPEEPQPQQQKPKPIVAKPRGRMMDNPGYTPAKTWEGLKWIGGKKPMQERQQVSAFKGFLPAKKMESKAEITAAVRRALVEVFAAKEEGTSLEEVCDVKKQDWSTGVNIRASGDGLGVELEMKPVDLQTASLQEEVEPSKAWKPISLQNPEIKFAVIKRVIQLTGLRISDPAIAESNTAGILLNKLITPPKPKKLAEKLESDSRFAKLPNVKVSARRITPIDKEKEVGRWKVIEQKLLDRNLPITGYAI